MRIDIKDILFEEFERTRLQILSNMQANDQIVSGKTADSLRSESNDTTGTLYGADYFDTLETGISPFQSRMSPFKTTYLGLRDWYQRRGLTTGFYKDSRIYMATVNQREIGSVLFRKTGGTPTGKVFRKEISPLTENIKNRISDIIINTKILP